MALPLNPPAMPYLTRQMLRDAGATPGEQIIESRTYWFWTYEERDWYVGPYTSRALAERGRNRYLKLVDGPELRPWVV